MSRRFLPGVLGSGILNPPDIATGLELWLDANDSGTITTTGSDVDQWDDKSAVGNDVVQSTTAKKPDVSTVNGNSSILFDGSSTASQADLLRDSTASITSPPATIAVVFTPTSVSAGTFAFVRWRDVFDNVFQMRRNGANLECAEGQAAQTKIMSVPSVLAVNETRWVIARFRNAGDGDHDMLTDEGNTDTVTGNASVNSSVDDINIGANANGANAYAGHVHEIIYYNKFLTDAERTNLDNYLDSKWTLS